MSNQRTGGVILLLLCMMPVLASAESSVWKISKGDDYLYLGGTIHILSKADFPLPDEFNQAYQDADTVVLEADVSTANSLEVQRRVLMETTYSGDGSVIQDLSADTVQMLKDHLETRGIPPSSLFRFKPGMLSITLTVLELQQLGFTEAGVDQHFLDRARNDGKSLGYLESADDQIDFLINMGKGHGDALMRHTLLEMEKLPRYMDDLRAGWRQGDLSRLEANGLDSWVSQFPQIYDTLLVDRNRNWIPEIERLMGTDEIELVLFGALHLVGEDGVLAMLENRGYRIDQLD